MPRDYAAKIAADNARIRAMSLVGRDIEPNYAAEAPTPEELAEREACRCDFRRFCETYFPAAFALSWSPDHLKAIGRIESAMLHGGLFALAMPRGSGKSTLIATAALWALVYGHRRFVAIVAATEGMAEGMLDRLRTELAYNEHLRRPFRAVCFPIRALQGNTRRIPGQLFRGESTRLVWTAKRLVLPAVPDDVCDGVNVSGSIVTANGLTGALRGQSHTLPSGETLRPELVLLDDPSTRESAGSESQNREREAIIAGDVLGMAGPGRKIAALAALTVIRPDDLADRLLNRERNPAWSGDRFRAVYAWPTAEALWTEYHRIRNEGLRDGKGTEAATAFYAANRAAMDEGAHVAWEQRHHPDELSAVQHVHNLRSDLGAEAFASEFQNEPLRPDLGDVHTLTPEAIAARVNGTPRGVVPHWAQTLTAGVDVHDGLLFYVVAAWSLDFTGAIIDAGAFPRQRRRDFTLRKASPTLRDVSPGAGPEGAIRAGLDAVATLLLDREWKRDDDGEPMRVERCLIDCGYMPNVVADFIRASPHAAILLASRGVGIGASGRPMHEYRRNRGDRLGAAWYIPAPQRGGIGRHVRIDVNTWKSFLHARLAMSIGDRGALTLWGRDARDHELIASHLCAEFPTRTFGNGRTVDEWRLRPGAPDNHLLDCTTMAAVAASLCGASLESAGTPRLARREGARLRLSELQGNGRRLTRRSA